MPAAIRWISTTTTELPRRCAALACGLLLAAAVLVADDAPLLRVELRPQSWAAAEDFLENVFRTEITRRDAVAGTLELIVREGDLPTLWVLGEVRIVERSRPFAEIQAERHTLGIDAPEEGYKTYPEILAWMDDVEARYPAIAKKVNLTRMFGTPMTWQGNEMFAIKLSDNVAIDEDEPAVLFDSLHHSNELNTMEMTLDIVNRLTHVYGGNPTATRFVDDYQIWVVPVVNPDGLDYVWSTNNLWRKNRRPNAGGSFGVDPNRNYPFGWSVCGNGSPNPTSGTYYGPEPLSEPENKTMVALGEWLRPTIYLSYHSSGREVLAPYRCFNLAEPAIVNTIRDLYRARMSYSFRPASSSGESFEHYYNRFSTIGFLTEVGNAQQPPFQETVAEVDRVRPGWIFLLESLTAGPLVSGHVTDSVTGEPVEAEISSSRVNFTEGERRACEPDHGYWSWFLPLEGQTLTFSAPGYRTKQVPATVALGGTTLDVELDPEP